MSKVINRFINLTSFVESAKTPVAADLLAGKEAWANGVKIIGEGTTGGDITLPTLRAVTISRNSTTLSISNPSTNGNFVTGYKIYSGSELKATQSSTSYNLLSMGAGDHTLRATAYGSNFTDSPYSNTVLYSVYSITRLLTNLTSSNTATVMGQEQTYSTTLTPSSGKYLPTAIAVTMGGEPAPFIYDNDTGVLEIANISGNIEITATASDYARLATPVIEIDGDILSWAAVSGATSYSVRSSGVQVALVTDLSVDLSEVFTEEDSYAMTVVAKGEGYQDSNVSNTVYFFIGVAPIYGVSGLYQSSPALTRTDSAVGMSFAINSSSGAISSDFNAVFPWNEATVEEIGGDKFLHMPEMWFRVGYDASKRITDVAVSKQASGAGNWYKVNPFYYSCYGGSVSGGKLKSVSGVSRQASATRAQFRSYAAANGSGYFQEDLYHKTVMSFLWWIEWATKDSSSIMTGRISGSGTSGGATVRPTGGTNAVTTPSGFETAYAQMRYHYIEDFIGNMLEFVDGNVGSGSSYYVTASPAAYSDATTGHANLPYGYPSNASSSNRCISAFGWDANNPFLCQPIEQIGTDYTIHFCDANSAANNVVLYCGAYYGSAGATFGLSYFDRNAASTAVTYFGGRLLYKP